MKPPSDQASLEREAREAEMRTRDKFCPECGAQVWPVDWPLAPAIAGTVSRAWSWRWTPGPRPGHGGGPSARGPRCVQTDAASRAARELLLRGMDA